VSAAIDAINSIATARLTLRPPVAGDADAIVRALQDWDVVKNLARVPWPYEPAHAAEFLARAATWRAEDSERTFAIDDGTFCGMIGVRGHRGGAATIGYWLARAAWGKGYATEAVRALVDYSFEHLPAESLNAGVVADNRASMRVLVKAGFARVGAGTCGTLSRGDQASVDFRLTRADWRPQ